ncbi:MAG: serine/threonine-protein kinase [Polyangiaceae bacterium]
MEIPNTTDDLGDLIGVELDGRRPGWRFRLERRLGGGSQGNAFLATRTSDGGVDPVVVKIWRPSFVLAHAELANLVLRKEYVALARLNDHVPPTPFVVRLIDGGDVAVRMRFATVTLPWLAIEYVHGGALGTTIGERVRECVSTSGTALSPARVRQLLGGIVAGLSAIHEAGIIHRDLKPSNVLVCGVAEDEMAKVADFGLSRPVGMSSTFGELAVGTPGYAAPEQMDAASVGQWSDVFSLAAIAFFLIAGEDMYGGTATVKMANVYTGSFRSLGQRQLVDAIWTKGALQRVENVLRRATQRDLQKRISQVSELWALLEPLLREAEAPGATTLAAGSQRTLKEAVYSPWTFRVAHREPQSLGLRTVAFDPDGHGLAAGHTGLWYWEGNRWVQMPPPRDVDPIGIHYLRRLGPARWIACGERGTVMVFTPAGRMLEERVDATAGARLHTASVLSERYLAVAGMHADGTPVVAACLAGQWTAPVRVEDADEIHALAPGGLGEWYLVGRDRAGRGLFASWQAETGAIHRWPVESAPLYAAASGAEGTVFAAGAGGFAFRKKEAHPVLERVFSHRDITAMAADPAGSVWAATTGRILHRPPLVGPADWSPVWSDHAHTGRFISVAALAGMILAAADDGSIVVGHQGLG